MQFDMGRVPPMTFGPGRLSAVPKIAKEIGAKRVFVVADQIMAQMGVTDRLEDAISAAGLAVDTAADVAGEPKDALVDALVALTAPGDVVVGLGGGAAMDAAKLVATIALSDEPALHYGLCANPFPQKGLPSIAVPTTAGTGSEVTRTSIVSTKEGLKYWYWGEELMFDHAVLDPDLTVSLPPHITAWTGIDAVAHALEAVTSRSSHEGGRLHGLAALRTLTEWLPRAVEDGASAEARAQVLWGAVQAGLALHNCNTHMGHNISHAIGSLAPVHHGLATGLALEVTLPWLTTQPEGADNYAAASAALGGDADAAALPVQYGRLMRAVGIPGQLPAACANVTPEALHAQMMSEANHGMSQNSACPVGEGDLEYMATLFLSLPGEEIAA